MKNNSISCLNDSISCLKIKFETLGENENDFEKEVFLTEAWKWEKKFHFLLFK